MLQSLKSFFVRQEPDRPAPPPPMPPAPPSKQVGALYGAPAPASVAPPRPPQPVLQPAPVPQAGPYYDGRPVPAYPRTGPAVPSVPPRMLLVTQDALIRELRQACSLANEDFDKFMLPAIERYAEYVHLLPASEYDHHADLGGLFRHGLEVALNASRGAEGKEFALNEVPSTRKFQLPRWRACAMLGGMLHDLGKAVIDVGAKDVSGGKVWNPHVQSLWDWVAESGIDHYMIHWRELRRHKEHDAISATVLVRIIPDETMRWLGEYGGRAAYDAMLLALTGSTDRNNPLIDVIKRADQASVAADRAEAQRRLASVGEAGSRSNAAQLVRAMRDLVLKGAWQVNTPGNIVWHTAGGLYVMYPQCAKEVVESLREAGTTNLPNDPPVILEILREAGIIEQKNMGKDASGKEQIYDLHRVKITATAPSGAEMLLDMTALKFANDRIIPDYYVLPPALPVEICDPDGKVTSRVAADGSAADDKAITPAAPDAAAAVSTAVANVEQAATASADAAPAAAVPAGKDKSSKAGKRGARKGKETSLDDLVREMVDAEEPAATSADTPTVGVGEQTDLVFSSEDEDEDTAGDEEEDTGPSLRDWGQELDHRDAVIQGERAAAANPFPPTTREAAQKWLKHQSRASYLSFILDKITRGDLVVGRDLRVVDGCLHVQYPECVQGCGIDPPKVLETLAEEGWFNKAPGGRKSGFIHTHQEGTSFTTMVSFTHGLTRVITMLLPAGALDPHQAKHDRGPYITGSRSQLADSAQPGSPLWIAIHQQALYRKLCDLYQQTEAGLAGQSPKRLYEDFTAFLAEHGVKMGARLVQLRFKDNKNPLLLECQLREILINPNYEPHTDEIEIQKAIGKA